MTAKAKDIAKLPREYGGLTAAAVLMMGIGWGGLYQLVTTTLPLVGQRWLFFMLLYIAVSGTAMPLVRFLNIRFTPLHRPLPPGGVIARQCAWIGLFVVACAWLQIPRVLTLPVAFFLALALVVIEVFLRSRELANDR